MPPLQITVNPQRAAPPTLETLFSGPPPGAVAAPTAAQPPAAPPPVPVAQQPLEDLFSGPPPEDPAERAALRTRASVRRAPPVEAAEPPLDPDVDYSTGMPMSLRIDLSRMDNPQEAELLLAKRFGNGNFGQDEYGNWWVTDTPTGKRTAVFPRDGLWEGTKNLAAGVAASTPANAGAGAGAGIGAALGGPPGAIFGAMAGGAAGKGIDEAVKYFGGLFSKTPAEAVGTLGNEGAFAGAFQGAAPLARAAKKPLQSAARWWGGVTPESATMGSDLMAGGARPPVSSLAPDLKVMEYRRNLRNVVAGDPVEPERAAYLDTRVRNMMRANGIPDAEIETAIAQVKDKSAAIPAREVGEAVLGKARTIETGLQAEERAALAGAEQTLDKLQGAVKSWAKAPPELADQVAGAIRADRRQFSQTMSKVYGTIDKMLGDVPLVPTDAITRTAREVVEIMDPQAVSPLLRRWASPEAQQMLTFEQAHQLRTTFREMAEKYDVSPTGQKLGNVQKVARAVDDTIRELSNSPDITVKAAADALRAADRTYAKAVVHFNDATMNKMVQQTRSGLLPEPTQVADLLTSAPPSSVERIWGVLPDNVKDGVRKADVANMIRAASHPDASGKMVVDGKALYAELMDRDAVNSIVHGARQTGFLKDVAKAFAAADGKMDLETLTDPMFAGLRRSLEEARAAKQASAKFAQANPRVALASNEPNMVDAASRYVTTPGAEARTEAAFKMLGATSPEWRAVETYAVKKLLHDAFDPTSALGIRVSGPAIERALGQYTPKQQELLFGRGIRADLRLLAQEARYLFPGDAAADFGTSLAGASTKGSLPSAVGLKRFAGQLISGFLADNPRFLKFLADEIRTDRDKARTTMSVIRQWAINGALAGPGAEIAPPKGLDGPPPAAPEKPVYNGPD